MYLYLRVVFFTLSFHVTHELVSSYFPVPVIGEVENALYRAVVFRTFAVVTLLAQFAAANRAALRRWFQAAHRAARDGRYLEGEILLNYVADESD